MKRRFGPILAIFALAGCSVGATLDSLNPFSGSESESPAQAVPVAPLYERIDRVETVEIGKAYRGIIVQTRGLSRREGYFAARLRLLNDGKPAEDGMIELEFLARPPRVATPPPGPDAVATFPLTAAQYLRAEQLDGAKGLRVVARDNALTQAF